MKTNDELKKTLDKLIAQRYQTRDENLAPNTARGGKNPGRIVGRNDIDLLEFCRDILDESHDNSRAARSVNSVILVMKSLVQQDLLYHPIDNPPYPAINVFVVVKHCQNPTVREAIMRKRNEDLTASVIDFNEDKLLRIIATMDKDEIDAAQIQVEANGAKIPLLILAVLMDRPRLLKLLLEKGADPTLRISPNPDVALSCNLLVAAILLQLPKIVEVLLATSLSFSERIGTNKNNATVLSDVPWHLAVLSGNNALFNLLYRKGIDINEKNGMGFDIFQLLQPQKNTLVYTHYQKIEQEWVTRLPTSLQTPDEDSTVLQRALTTLSELLRGGNAQHQQMLRFLQVEQRQLHFRQTSQAAKVQMWQQPQTQQSATPSTLTGKKRLQPGADLANAAEKRQRPAVDDISNSEDTQLVRKRNPGRGQS